jgi:hypothetical protein
MRGTLYLKPVGAAWLSQCGGPLGRADPLRRVGFARRAGNCTAGLRVRPTFFRLPARDHVCRRAKAVNHFQK